MASTYFGDDNNNSPLADDYYAMYGAAGNDVLGSSHGGNVYVEAGLGHDLVFILGALGVATFYGGDGNDFMVGRILNDSLYGGADNDLLIGGSVASAISGMPIVQNTSEATGNDMLDGGPGTDACYGFDGNDTILGGEGNDSGSISLIYYGDPFLARAGLFGGDGNDYIDGGRGNDWIDGGHGRDTLVGGIGRDTFDFNSVQDSRGSLRDTIVDFRHAEHDRIDLSTIDAKTGSGNQAFTFVGGAGFHHHKGELRYASGMVSADTNGDGKADFQIKVLGAPALHASDFVL
ncbi:MAG: M10 family metallopeptidase C-terminal domain-containing protein [Chromatiales bacterium]|nr:M10 family metallopeptidase C-terminal domain-containing protein [Chromatiales bacterium]